MMAMVLMIMVHKYRLKHNQIMLKTFLIKQLVLPIQLHLTEVQTIHPIGFLLSLIMQMVLYQIHQLKNQTLDLVVR